MIREVHFKNEAETADMTIRLEMAGSRFHVIGRTTIAMDSLEPALVLPPTFVYRLRERLFRKDIQLLGVAKHKDFFNILTSKGCVTLKGSFSINDVVDKLKRKL